MLIRAVFVHWWIAAGGGKNAGSDGGSTARSWNGPQKRELQASASTSTTNKQDE
jgi:hypothetical protein